MHMHGVKALLSTQVQTVQTVCMCSSAHQRTFYKHAHAYVQRTCSRTHKLCAGFIQKHPGLPPVRRYTGQV